MQGFVSSSGGKIFAVGRDGHSVDGAIVRFEGGSDLEVGVPDFESSVPSDRGEVRFELDLALGFEERGVSDT